MSAHSSGLPTIEEHGMLQNERNVRFIEYLSGLIVNDAERCKSVVGRAKRRELVEGNVAHMTKISDKMDHLGASLCFAEPSVWERATDAATDAEAAMLVLRSEAKEDRARDYLELAVRISGFVTGLTLVLVAARRYVQDAPQLVSPVMTFGGAGLAALVTLLARRLAESAPTLVPKMKSVWSKGSPKTKAVSSTNKRRSSKSKRLSSKIKASSSKSKNDLNTAFSKLKGHRVRRPRFIKGIGSAVRKAAGGLGELVMVAHRGTVRAASSVVEPSPPARETYALEQV